MITAQNSKPDKKGQPEQKGSQTKDQKRSRGQSERKREPPQFTLLNISYDRLLPLIRDHLDFKWPPPIQSDPEQRYRSLRCDYHRDHKHETNRCRTLKFLVERLIRASHLKSYIRVSARLAKTAPVAERIATSSKLPSEPRPTINYILGGLADDQYQSKRQRKNLLQVATFRARANTISTPNNSRSIQSVDDLISFPPINPSKVITPHQDALVLTLCINNFDVHRVLVDPSSATDLLQLPAFRQMKVSLDKLSLTGRILFGFNGATMLTIGDIALPVKVGPVTQQVLFSVVKDFGPYNAIVGRAWLHAIKAVPSTYHQTISYLTSVEQIDLLSSQLAARQCYHLSVQEREKDESSNNLAPESQSPEYQSQFTTPGREGGQGTISYGSLGINTLGRAR